MATAKKFWLTGLTILLLAGSLSAQTKAPAKKQPKKPVKRPAAAATQEEVKALRETVGNQEREISGLKSAVDRLTAAVQQATAASQQAQSAAQQAQTTASQAQRVGTEAGNAAATADQRAGQAQAAATEAKTTAVQKTEELQKKVSGLQVGWNGEHVYIKSSDGKFEIQPYGYVQTDYRAYSGDRAAIPPDTFVVRRARMGFQGSLGKRYTFALLAELAFSSNNAAFASTPTTSNPNSSALKDGWFNVNLYPGLQFRVGQFKEPYSQEQLLSVAYIDFVERAALDNLTPQFTPGFMVHGQLFKGAIQYQTGIFNDKGVINRNDTSTPGTAFRLRFYPWRNTEVTWLKGLGFGGAVTNGHTNNPVGSNANITSFSGALPTGTFTFFAADRINGGILRTNAEFTWTFGPAAIRGEYDQTNQKRVGLAGRTGITNCPLVPANGNCPGVISKGFYIGGTYLLTGEKRPENGQPTPKHMFLEKGVGGLGAWELKFRYGGLSMADGPFGTAGVQRNRGIQIQSGINWYPTTHVRYMLDFNVEQLRNPIGTISAQTFLSVLQRIQFRF